MPQQIPGRGGCGLEDHQVLRRLNADEGIDGQSRVIYVIAPDGKIIYEYTSLSPD